ncbi:MAG: RluA family pseudouridine synthase [Clostridiales bacterium]|nr:RluA family pseudouridine synthase [Clostridiales bacterium]
MRELIIEKNDAGQRLDKFLSKAVPALPTSLLYKFIRLKKIKVNRARTEQGYMLQKGDTVQLFIKEEFFDQEAVSQAFTKLTPRLDILYEDEQILLCDKRPGLLVHSDQAEQTNTLISHIQAYLYRKGEYLPDREHSFAPALCNRIDRNTGGIVIAAKSAEALRILNETIKRRELTKKYLCALHGSVTPSKGSLKGYLIKDPVTNQVTVYDRNPSGKAKEIQTDYRILEEKNGLSLAEVTLITGRTHQIRAHFAHIGHPLLGDGKYGVNSEDKKRGYKFQALYSYQLTFHFQEQNALSYLDGRTFEVDRNKIWFLKEFDVGIE